MRDQVGGPDGRVAVPPGELVEGQGRERLNVVVGKLRQLSLDVIFAAWRLVKQTNKPGQAYLKKCTNELTLEAQGFLKKVGHLRVLLLIRVLTWDNKIVKRTDLAHEICIGDVITLFIYLHCKVHGLFTFPLSTKFVRSITRL